ncbi:hypothetical protein X560_0564 [Listeria fleischmannii 1991]|uniref:Uncharacterized protein n=1 Tax=Listeria fleischmannii 1991 TaxID=1430899 RepID=A0A0J8J7Y0_9LIST|nr:hypothetical protein X560_0564 [Listeria fleischmannii 1991]
MIYQAILMNLYHLLRWVKMKLKRAFWKGLFLVSIKIFFANGVSIKLTT